MWICIWVQVEARIIPKKKKCNKDYSNYIFLHYDQNTKKWSKTQNQKI